MPRKPRQLSADELAVWDQVTQTLRPLTPVDTPRVAPDPRKVKVAPRPASPAPIGSRTKPVDRPQPKVSMDLAPDPAQPAGPVRMDAKAYGRLKRGKMGPEARLDLHGLTQGRAHGVLSSFIQQAHAQGLRLVLVITGKGSTRREEPDAMTDRKGTLRHAVPQWLAQAPVAPLILQVTPAHQRHGGTGAYYVYLRRRR